MASLSSGLNPNDVRTALDDVFEQEFSYRMQPQYATAETPAIFHQSTTDRQAVIWETFKGGGLWQVKNEEADVPQQTPRIGNQKTFSVSEFAGQIDIPRLFKRDDQHQVYEKAVSNFASRARDTRDSNAFGVFRNSQGSQLTSDGVALISTAHTNQSGTTISNRITTAFSETTLSTAITNLLEMKAQDDVVGGSLAETLLVPPVLFPEAVRQTESVLRPGTGNNDVNYVSAKYGLAVYTNQFLGAAAGGSDAACFLLGRNHSIYRFVREGVQTTLVDWSIARNNNYVYKGMFSEVVGAMSFEGVIGIGV